MAPNSNDIRKLAKEIREKRKKVSFFVGAGASTAAGIPDFRSPKTGLYANLSKLKLPYAEAVFDIEYFRENPKAFYTLADELLPGKFVPTKFHYMIRLFQDHKLLKRVYTQNIDTLERIAGVEDKYMVEAHGSFANSHCIDCRDEMSIDELKSQMSRKDLNDGIPTCSKCKGYVKPDIVFFGEGLPVKFFDTWDEDADRVQVAIVAGTSLTVYPFASLPAETNRKCIRALINNEVVGDFKTGRRNSDLVLLGDCEEMAERLCDELGWTDELDRLMEKGKRQIMSKAYSEESAEHNSKVIAGEVAREVARKVSEEESKAKNDHTSSEEDDKSKSSPSTQPEGESTDLEREIAKLKI